MKYCVVLIFWLYKKAIIIMINFYFRNSKYNLVETKRTGVNIPLGSNKYGSLGRLKRLPKNLNQKQEVREAYDSVIKVQFENNIIEVTDTEINNSSKNFHMPHRAIIHEGAKSTKLYVVDYASVKSEFAFSLNDYSENGPRL